MASEAKYEETPADIATVRCRELGRRLREVKDDGGLKTNVLARMMGMVEPRLSRIVCGLVMPTQAEVGGLLAYCGVTGRRQDHILDLADPRHDLSALRLVGSEQWHAYAAHAVAATLLTDYQPTCIPPLVQTPNYSATYLASLLDWPVERDELGRALRRVVELDNLASAEIIIHEWRLRTSVGSAELMSEQLHHLLSLSITGPACIRVIGRDHRPKHVLPGGFALLNLADQPDVVYRDELTSGLFVDDPSEVGVHRSVVERLRLMAFNEPRLLT